MKKKLVSLVPALVMCMSLCVPAFAAEPPYSNATTLLQYQVDSESIRIGYLVKSNGNRSFQQYVNSVLTEECVLPYNNSDIVVVTNYDCETGIVTSIKTLMINEYIQPSTVNLLPDAAALAATLLGTIRYKAILPSGAFYYNLKAVYTTSAGQGTYTIDAYKGTLVTLIALLASAVALPAEFAAVFLNRLLVSAGITAGSAGLSAALTTTVSSAYIEYEWTISDVANSSVWKNVYGYKYTVNDTRYHTGEVYYEMYCPKDWGTQSLAVGLHDELFAYSPFEVVQYL